MKRKRIKLSSTDPSHLGQPPVPPVWILQAPQLSFPTFCPSTSANGSTWAKLTLCES
ncbi:hypothetical protein BDP55DRAFT_22158 [Colletotrichum godetiae]|uniref:Uncharacterized protein n=1 Tax=Colletotrichum godetiae TaxID=1209918 RepID=A0AAJ0B107_9PEZI|nr:uncharacterized protein BDP55DRAFT_22158 [Colletotrichum godetiae]KAK1701473.1 hypothetical protein BDP55DRAFT_22158 [Colletotrichum godetiae]